MKWSLGLFFLFIASSFFSEAKESIDIEVRSLSYVSPGPVLLKDLAQIRAKKTENLELLQNLIIVDSLSKGVIKKISQFELMTILRTTLSKKNLKFSQGLNFKLPSQIHIRAGINRVSRKAIKAKLHMELKRRCSSCEYKIKIRDLSSFRNQWIKRWELDLTGRRLLGNTSIPIEFYTYGAKKKKTWLSMEVTSYRKVPVLKRQASQKEPLKASDVSYQLKNVTHYRYGVPELSQIVGAKLKRSMSAQSVIWLKDLKREKAVRRGQVIDVGFSKSVMSLELRASAKQDGYVGDIIQLENVKTKKLLSGRIVQKGRVEIQ